MTADGPCSHDLKRVHDFRDASEGGVTRFEWCIERLTRSGDDVTVKTKPVDISTAGGPSLAIEHERGATASDVCISYEIDGDRLCKRLEYLWGQWKSRREELRYNGLNRGVDVEAESTGDSKGHKGSGGVQ